MTKAAVFVEFTQIILRGGGNLQGLKDGYSVRPIERGGRLQSILCFLCFLLFPSD